MALPCSILIMFMVISFSLIDEDLKFEVTRIMTETEKGCVKYER